MAKKADNQATTIVVQNLVIKPANRASADILSWRTALSSAERGRRTALFDLYEDILLDNFLADAIEKRVEAITNADIVFATRDGESVEEIDNLIDTSEFEALLKEIMSARFWGCALIQLEFTPEKKLLVWPVPKKHIRPKERMIAFDQSDEIGYPTAGDDRFVFVGDDKNLGLILKACPYVIYKRGGFGDWAQFAEVFGMPFRKATYDGYDDNARVLLEQAMEAAGSASYAVVPKGTDFEIMDPKSQGNGQVYKALRDACNEEILVGVLGQTMTTQNGSSRSQSETHMDVQENKHKSDRRFVQRILNEYIVPLLEKRGLPVKEGWFSFPEKGESIGLKDRIEIDTKLADVIDIPEDYYYETYGIPKPKSAEKVGEKPGKKKQEATDDKTRKSLVAKIESFFVKALRERGAADLDF